MADNIAQSGIGAKALVSPLAHRFAEMCLIRQELSLCVDTIRLWTKRDPHVSGDDALINTALFRDAIIQFTACFGHDDERLNPEAAFHDIDGGLEYFAWLRDVRDSYGAHRFGTLRQAVPVVVLGGEPEIVVGHMGSIYAGPGEPQDHANLIMFFEHGLKHAQRVVRDLTGQLVAEVAAMPPQARAALVGAKLHPLVAPEFIRMTRENYRKPKSRRRAGQHHRRRQAGSDPPAQKS